MSNKGFDTPNNAAKIAVQAKTDGYVFAAMYYFISSSYKTLLTKSIAQGISDAGLYVVSVYENGYPTSASYFTEHNANQDAQAAVSKALAATQPGGTYIYFAVDGDVPPASVEDYFKAVHSYVKAHGYLVGVYGSGAVCKRLTEIGYVSRTWLSQSHGWAGYQEWLPHADIVQGPTGTYHGADVDFDTSNGNAGGWKI